MAGVTRDGGGGLSPSEIYQQLTQGPGTGSLDEAQQVTSKEAWAETGRSEKIRKLAEKIKAGWDGPASDAAYGATTPLARVAEYRADDLQRSQQFLSDQSGAFHTAKNSVKPVSATPPPNAVVTEAIPWIGDLDGSMKQYQNDSQNNITVYSAYDTASNDNGDRLPKHYPSLEDNGSAPDIVRAEPKTDDSTPTGTGGGSGSGSHTGTGAPSVPSGSPTSSQTSPHQSAPPVTQGPPVPTGSTSASSVTTPDYQPTTAYPQSPAAQGTNSPTGFAPYSGGPGYGPGSQPGGGYRGGGGGGGGAGAGAGAGARSGGAPEAGARSGAGAMAAEEAMARRAGAAGAGRGGMAGMGGAMGGGHGGAKDEDTEHERPSYLQEDDPEDIFGTDEVTAPPVIE